MGWIKKLIEKRKKYYCPDEEEMESLIKEGAWEEVVYTRENLDVHDTKQRREYVHECLEQIAEASKEVDALTCEYNSVTAYLQDMEELESLPEKEKAKLNAAAARVALYQDVRENFQGRSGKMSDEQFYRMERLEDEVEEGVKKLTEAEDYHNLVKRDMNRLDAERQAFQYRKNELLDTLGQSRNFVVSCTVIVFVAFFVLLVLQFALELDAGWGNVLVAVVATVAYVILYVRYHEAEKELKRLEHDTNRLIQLQNKVKIRYINNIHLLNYLYMKYQVKNAKELQNLSGLYKEEKEARENYNRAQLDLDENEQELLRLLKCYQIKDPVVWLHQPEAILDHREMVELRHGLIVRRQALRKRMDYDRDVLAGNAQKEIKDLVVTYPRYAQEIIAMVDQYM